MAADLPQEDHAKIIADYECGRSHILLQLSLKLSHWQGFPWAAYAAASTDQTLCCRALQQISESRCQHPQVAAFQTSQAEADIEQFLADPEALFESRDASFLPCLRRLLTTMRLAFSAERKIEGKHAKSQKGITHAPHHSIPYVSLLHRLPYIKVALESSVGDSGI